MRPRNSPGDKSTLGNENTGWSIERHWTSGWEISGERRTFSDFESGKCSGYVRFQM